MIMYKGQKGQKGQKERKRQKVKVLKKRLLILLLLIASFTIPFTISVYVTAWKIQKHVAKEMTDIQNTKQQVTQGFNKITASTSSISLQNLQTIFDLLNDEQQSASLSKLAQKWYDNIQQVEGIGFYHVPWKNGPWNVCLLQYGNWIACKETNRQEAINFIVNLTGTSDLLSKLVIALDKKIPFDAVQFYQRGENIIVYYDVFTSTLAVKHILMKDPVVKQILFTGSVTQTNNKIIIVPNASRWRYKLEHYYVTGSRGVLNRFVLSRTYSVDYLYKMLRAKYKK